ncbi:PGL/p-HBAD biosynthesis glycosyltransferase [Candidatus Phycosocius bacilliformis]|uniref:PGL/p-HBAD biosynthesis glycosyltransferase n=1 Tax=Candidatus Phycosocius bacilliformis TaxID=1445552 RepID=A0A2P2E6I3_9PROT|nr:glycosyltransferase [Candidatus Phycosocius bacilliformis]GBF56660.1 PGL/p-HBAD biosynthesis glycosyltransferase [Candidatus Phycosocius bacilliformis]
MTVEALLVPSDGANEKMGTQKQAKKEYNSNVLILANDIFSDVGGGQTSYQAIIRNRPDVHFFYFVEKETKKATRPPNCTIIPFNHYYRYNVGDLPAEIGYFYSDYIQAWQYARSFAEHFANIEIDVVDTPDYTLAGLFIEDAMKMHGIRVGSVSLALHGTISSAFSQEWGQKTPQRFMAELRVREHLQYRSVDSRYALSEAYGQEWTRKSGGYEANYIDPLLMVGPMNPKIACGIERPSLAFIGRRERTKGPDIFVDALWSVDRASYNRAMLIGSESTGYSGVSGDPRLAAMAKLRGLDIQILKSLPRAKLDEIFSERTVVVVPSRADTFNLVALEAIRLGAPVLVSRGAGISRWIETHLPELSHLVFDLGGARALDKALIQILSDYDGERERLVQAVQRANLQANLESLASMYQPADKICQSAREYRSMLQARLNSFNRPRDISHDRPQSDSSAFPHTPGYRGFSPELPSWKKAILTSPLRGIAYAYHDFRTGKVQQKRLPPPKDVALQPGYNDPNRIHGLIAKLSQEVSDRSDRALEMVPAAEDIEGTRYRSLHLPERTQKEIVTKLKTLASEIPSRLVGRNLLFRELMRLERKRSGGDIVAATYALRLMRWAGVDHHNDLDFVVRALEKGGFGKVAEVARALFEDQSQTNARVQALLATQFESQKIKKSGSFAIKDDRRSSNRPRVSVIVSLYNAASKLPLFLRQLSAQTLMAVDEIEIILVDSGSPTNEYEVFKELMAELPLPALYVRTKNRETIQSAWNRGIALAKGEYLSFLGVDEGVHPRAFEILSKELDEDQEVDWVMADTVMTEVDRRGTFKSDVMIYNRDGYNQGLVYLDTCYLSWVGGLYRRSIHERFGMYDETFSAAGDTEFKSRMLPHLKSKRIKAALGLFLNYPEERTTQHPRAEIEDLRAWYVYRTKAGVAYVWDNQPIKEVEAFFKSCLGYRKSFCGHFSTDFEMAEVVAQYMVERNENPEFAREAVSSTVRMNQFIRSITDIDMRLSPAERRLAVLEILAAAKKQEVSDQSKFGLGNRPRYEIVNDNRFEQHWHSWSS